MTKLKAMTGSGFGGLIAYMTEKEASSFICGSQETAKDFLRECSALRSARPDCKKPVLHFSLSQPPGEKLTDEQWVEAVDKFLTKMGLQDHSHFVVRHSDTDHDHIHISVNKIGTNGRLWATQNSAKLGMKAVQEIEMEMGLTITRSLADHRKEGHGANPISNGALRQFQRSGTLPVGTKKRIQERIKNERAGADRAAHRNADQDHGGLVDRPPSNSEKNHGTGRKNQDAGKTPQRLGNTDQQHLSANAEITAALKKGASNGKTTLSQNRHQPRRAFTPWLNRRADRPGLRVSAHAGPQRMPVLLASRPSNGRQEAGDPLLQPALQGFGSSDHGLHGLQPGGGITSKNAPSISPTPPTLNGRITPKPAPGMAFDLYWPGRHKPSFRWHSDQRKIELLAEPNRESVSALFDLVKEKQMGEPIEIFGDYEFLAQASMEAARRGVRVDFSVKDGDTLKQYYQIQLDRMESDRVKAYKQQTAPPKPAETKALEQQQAEAEVKKPRPRA